MKCPHCQKEISDKTVASEFGRIGGAKSRRAITPEQQKKMQDARRKKKEQV